MGSGESKLRVHVVSETAYVGKGQGVHTAFVDCVNLLKRPFYTGMPRPSIA